MIRRTIAATLAVAALSAAVPAAEPATAWSGQCTRYEPLLRTYAPRGGWDINRMSYYMWRESRCLPWVVNVTGNDTGLLQFHPITWPWIAHKFRIPLWRVQAWLKDPANNVRAGAALCTFWRSAGRSCYQPWRIG